MTPTFLSYLKPLSARASRAPAVGSTLRLSMGPALDRSAIVDGAWWPYSVDAAAELPGLIAAVDRRLGRTTLRVTVYRQAWDHLPRRIAARGRQVRVGWFGQADPPVVTLSFDRAEPIVLLVIPPGAGSGSAQAALILANQGRSGFAAAHFLTIAHLPAAPGTGAREQGGFPGWDDEGRRVIGN
ncbi:DUF5994 family protein [Nonomuraea sp. NPDC050786]|uniref:DUF5994 family protein n=1 Tax=Nonomuraea sp. NPDC050786 TaxID=3154840 RepID=UPI0033EC91C1